MGHHIRVNCGNCNRLFYCNGKDLTCAECKAYPSNTDNTGNPESKDSEMNIKTCDKCNTRWVFAPGQDDSVCGKCNVPYAERGNKGNLKQNKLPDTYQPFGKDTATCIKCTRLYNSRENPGTMICPACNVSEQNKTYEVISKTCSSCKTRWAFPSDADTTKCPHCNQLYERTESVRQEERNKIASNKENHKIIESLVRDLVLENNNLLVKVNHNKLRIATLETLMGMLK